MPFTRYLLFLLMNSWVGSAFLEQHARNSVGRRAVCSRPSVSCGWRKRLRREQRPVRVPAHALDEVLVVGTGSLARATADDLKRKVCRGFTSCYAP